MPKGWNDDEIETAARMYAAGESYRSIGEQIRKKADTVRHYIRAHSELFPEPMVGKDILLGEASYRQITRYMAPLPRLRAPHHRLQMPCVLDPAEKQGRIRPHG